MESKSRKAVSDSEEYFNEVADRWNDVRLTLFSDGVRDAAIKAADVKPGLLAADIGAGTGFITEGLVKKNLRVIAVDQSPAMMDEMKKRFGRLRNVELRVGESADLPIESGSVDYVFANMYLHHVESPYDAIKEMVRILKPDGKLIITDADEHTYEFLRTEQHDRWLGFNRSDILTWFKNAGLTEVKVDCTNENCCPTSEHSGEKVEISIFVATGKKKK
ncbi:class I SAM-dependent methyltransferase [bacterium]|nr:class I SAM-dependent methyltransferase [bacterium]